MIRHKLAELSTSKTQLVYLVLLTIPYTHYDVSSHCRSASAQAQKGGANDRNNISDPSVRDGYPERCGKIHRTGLAECPDNQNREFDPARFIPS